jgi:hypothetical protein
LRASTRYNVQDIIARCIPFSRLPDLEEKEKRRKKKERAHFWDRMLIRAVLVAIVLEVRRQLPAPLARGARLLKTGSCRPPKRAWRAWCAVGRRRAP